MPKISTDGFDLARDVLFATQTLMKEKWQLWDIALKNAWNLEVTTDKLERAEMVYELVKLTLSAWIVSWYFDTTDKSVSVSSGALNLLVWQTLTFKTSAKLSRWTLTIIVTWITNDTTFTARKIGWTDVALSSWDIATVQSTVTAEGETNTNYNWIKLTRKVYNYTQSFRVSWEISWRMARINTWNFEDIKTELLKQVQMDLKNNLSAISCGYVRNRQVIAWKTYSFAGWLPFFLLNKFDTNWDVVAWTPTNVITVWWALTLNHIYDAFQHAIENNWSLNAILCSPKQARAISTFEGAKINIQLLNWSNATKVWWAVQVLESPIKVGDNMISAIYVDTTIANDELYVFNEWNIQLIPMVWRGLIWMEVRMPYEGANTDKDVYSISWLGEWSFYYMNSFENWYVLKWLS